MNSSGKSDAMPIDQRRMLPSFGDSPMAMRVSLLLPVLTGVLVGVQGHGLFQGVKVWQPSVYNPASHGMFLALMAASVLGVFAIHGPLSTRRNLGFLLFACHMALSILIQQATRFVLP